ncbi:lasso peptide biosynthesis B2 protein [Seongchinamella unica]|uniref:Lasso peptide biosynthesis B2 protein n=1 Tax=Seongchinamella unica TaxID=2547392 RepID=A0A4R5LQT2_9GAMM|nr:lasso peptide biosynthesis B2 protein [Seongchinamella unica]TDG12901.1 lasso peptide biosynthesis B2 protein [Seongchinamella unica]
MHRAKKFLALSFRQKMLMGQAWCLLLYYRLALASVPLKRITRDLARDNGGQTPPALAPEIVARAEELGRLVAHAAAATPWSSRCLAQVLATRHLLVRRGIPGQFYLGVNREGFPRESDSLAHAWLQCGDRIVSGEAGSERFVVIAGFAW